MIPKEQVLSVTPGVLITCAEPLRPFNAGLEVLSKPYDSVSGSLIITNYKLLFKTPQCALLGFPVRYIFSIKFEEEQLRLELCNAISFELQGDLQRAVAFLHGLLTPEFSDFQLFWSRGAVEKQVCELQPGKSFIYAQHYRRLHKSGLMSSSQPCGRDLYDPFREYVRQGVEFTHPTKEELSVMVFGEIIDSGLINFLISNKPSLNRDTYAEDVKHITNRNIQFFENEFQQKQRCNEFYDPRTLFKSDEDFYDLLMAHPCHTNEYFKEFEREQAELEVQMRKDAELTTEDSEDQTPAPLQQAMSIFTKFTNQLKEAIGQEAVEQKERFVPEYACGTYCHGCFFAPSYFRQTPEQRENLKIFIYSEAHKFDNVHTSITNAKFRISYLNAGYAVSPTYPAILAVAVDDILLHEAMKFRSRGRIAALSYAYNGQAFLTRCAQPGSGFGISRDSADETLLKNSCDGLLIVFDARQKIAAFGNVISGKGFESKAAYPFTQTYYCGIQNIHAIRKSKEVVAHEIVKLQSEKAADFEYIAQMFYDSKWFEHMELILFSAEEIVFQLVRRQTSCMVHCSDGWDRTSELTSLVMLLIDPYFRTIKGFCILVIKEWLSFGHMFATRNRQVGSTKVSKRKPKEYFEREQSGGLRFLEINTTQCNALEAKDPGLEPPRESDFRYSSSQTSPIFFEFLDAVYQLFSEFPLKFEFNPRLLTQMARYAFNGRFGDFEFDNERMRVENLVFQATDSCFDDVLSNIGRYVNPVYTPVNLSESMPDVLECSWNTADFRVFWDLWMM